MNYPQGLHHLFLVIAIILLVVYSAMRECIPDMYNGIIAGVAIALLLIYFILSRRKQH